MTQLVSYSVTMGDPPRLDLLWQLDVSLRSLRAHNLNIPVVVFAYGWVPAELRRTAAAAGAWLWPLEPYERRLARLLPRGWAAMAAYPLLHKLLNFDHFTALGADRVLCLDCDTLFADDVAVLFERYEHADCWAREEPTCGRSHYGYDPAYLDEEALVRAGATEGLRLPPPFNLGVVLWNRGAWRRTSDLGALAVEYAWRFLVWLAAHPAEGAAAAYGESAAARVVAAHANQFVTGEDVRRALPYPSSNRWILDQVALWFAMAHLPGLTYGDFSRGDVIQNGEFLAEEASRGALPDGKPRWVLCHYFSQNRDRIVSWLDGRAKARAGSDSRAIYA